MAPKSQTVERLVGLFILLPFILLAVLVLGLAREKGLFEHWISIRAPFPPETIVPVGAKVMFGGVEIGRVVSVMTDEKGRTIANLSVRRRPAKEVRTDSKASLVRPNFIGDPVVNISFGSPKAEHIRDEGTMAMKVRGPDEPEDVTPENVRELFSNALHMSRRGKALLDVLSQPDGPMLSLLANSDRLLRDLLAAREQIVALLKDQKAFEQQVVARIADILGGIDRLARERGIGFPITHRSGLELMLNPRLEGQVDELVAMAKKLEGMMDKTMNTENSVSLLLRDRELYDRLLGLLSDTKVMVAEIRDIMDSLRKVSPDLGALVASGRSMLDRGSRLLKGLETNPFLGARLPEPRPEPPVDIEQRFHQYKVNQTQTGTAPTQDKK